MSFSVFMQSFGSALQFFCSPSAIFSSLALIFLYLLFSWGIRKASQTTESEEAGAPGCLTSILMILFQTFVAGFFILLNLHLLLRGATSFSSQEDLITFGYLAVRGGLLAALVALVISLIPKAGKFFNSSPGLEFFVLLGISFYIQAPVYFLEKTGLPAYTLNLQSALVVGLIYFILTIVATRLMALSLFLALKKQTSKRINFFLKYFGPALDLAIGIFIFVAFTQCLVFSLY